MMSQNSSTSLASGSSGSGLALRDLLYVFFKHQRQIIIICLSAFIISGIYLLLASPVFKAEAAILVKLGKDELSAIETIPREQNNFLLQQRAQIINNEIEILRSEDLSRRVAPLAKLKKERLAEEAYAAAGPLHRQVLDLRRAVQVFVTSMGNAVKDLLVTVGISRRVTDEQAFEIELAEKISIVAVEETEVVRISFSADNAAYAAYVTNAYLDEYFKKRLQVHNDERSEQFYEKQIDTLQTKLKIVENNIASFQIENGVTNLDLQKDLLVREIAELEKQFFQVNLALQETYVRKNDVVQAETRGIGVVPAPASGSSADYSGLDDAYFRLAAERARLGAKFDPMAREMTDLGEQQVKLRQEKAAGVVRGLSGDAAVRQAERDGIEKRLKEQKTTLAKLNDATTPLADMERERELLRSSYLGYAKQTEQLRLSFDLNRADITSVKTLARATQPILPVSPKRPLVLALALAAGLLLSFAWAVLAEFFDHTFRDARDVEAQLDLPTLANLGWDNSLVKRGVL